MNAITVRRIYQITRIKECIVSLDGAQMISTLDANPGNCKIDMDKEDVDKKMFVTCHGLFHSTRMPFCLKHDPATFQRAMVLILASIMWRYALVYTKDTTVFFKSSQIYLLYIEEVNDLLRNTDETIKLKKFHFFC